ncbi:MAG TPA: NAD-dependent epimerase/dehydratase family protein [Bacillota bacterium]|nr:NAD-dependent epimerase/dehydratase family protein [Clostridiaceae bacterium]HNR03601.1 NAD-dependent epimerase/dehydratase family protein [Bacillota bacterium]HPB17509.1 NAD-dependent epimerase/dehydratase family protein [Clostridia bacterium]HNT02589.1 NAD-dependent epimerase/dehydratase family protein [Bacillota bacterium]HOH88558.1 NAD-dependent epimerase/dehydratase family protein [Bacillota bacterium]
MNILVIGGQGFIGHNLVLKLVSEGHKVTVFEKNFKPERKLDSCDYTIGSFSEIAQYENVLEGMDIVYHLISTTIPKTSMDNPSFDIQSNVVDTIKLLELCCKHKVRKIIFPSSGGTIYGLAETIPISEDHPTNPICSYGITKLSIEKYLHMFNHLYGLDYQVFRISNPYGPFQNPFSNQGAVGVFLGKILRGEEIEIWGDGSVCRDYIFISDVVQALYLASEMHTDIKVLNIGSGKGVTLNDLVDIISRVTSKEAKVVNKESREIDLPVNVLDISKAADKLMWFPQIPLEKGIEITWDWLMRYK